MSALPGTHLRKDHQGNHSHYDKENCEICKLRKQVGEQSAALKLVREVRFDMQDSYAAVHGWKDSFVIAATTAIAAIDEVLKGE